MVRIKFDRDSVYDDTSGLINIGASSEDSNLKFMNFEALLYQQIWIIRQAVKHMDIITLQNAVQMFACQLTPYTDKDTMNLLDFYDKKSKELIDFYDKSVSNKVLKNELIGMEKCKNIYTKLEKLIDVMKINKFLFNDKLYLSLLLSHYSDLQKTVIKNPYAFFNSVLMLKSILKPYIYEEYELKLNTKLKELSRKLQYLALSSRLNPTRKIRNQFMNELLSYGYQILSLLTMVMDKKGLLAQVQVIADLSKVRFDINKHNMNQEERLATDLLGDVIDRLQKENKNWLAVIVGGTGSGKSYSAIWLAQKLDPTFHHGRIAFTFKEFMDILTSKDTKAGSVIIWDESGVDLDSRRFYSDLNVLANRILQTFRKDNLGVIFTVPDASFVDSRARTLFHAIIETQSIIKSENKVKVKWYEVHRSVQSKKEAYLWHPRYIINGRHFKIDAVLIPKPSEELIRPYEAKKKGFTDNLKTDVKAELSDTAKTQVKKMKQEDLRELMKEVLKGDETAYAKVKDGIYNFNADILRFKFNLGIGDAKKLKYMLEEFLNQKRI